MIDPSRTANIPVALGGHLSRGSGRSEKRTASIQWNYKPRLQSSDTTRIGSLQRSSDQYVDLTIQNSEGSGRYHYKGTQQPSGACALIYNPSTKTFVLDRIDADFTFNLQCTPSNENRSDVTSQYPQLDTSISDIESEDGQNAEAGPSTDVNHSQADANNPYDYRHFLKRRRTSSPEAAIPRPSVSPAVPPRQPARTNTKPKPRPCQQPQVKRPSREDTKASSGDSDDGDLIIEMGDSPKRRRFGNGAVVFNHDGRNGPVSLRSAASSMSPASIRHDSGNEDAESDRDVEHLRLPSPARRPNGPDDGEEDRDDDEDELAAHLLQAMEGQEEEVEEEGPADAEAYGGDQTIRRTIEQSSSESEEE
ncbi:MAG: hypothetical protein Q9201_002534 [Fulgogasparrea decipioides]